MTRPSFTLLRALAALLAFTAIGAFAQPADPRPQHRFGESRPIPGRYIVVYNDSVGDADVESDRHVRRFGGQRHQLFRNVFKGFVASMSEASAQRLRLDPTIAFIEQDHTVSLNQLQSPATWGLDRIDQVDRPLDMLYHYSYTGQGVHAFIIDTGIRADHTEFTGRVLAGYSSINDGRGTNDCNGHGTHVAGTVGGSTWGVARKVSITPVRVLDCSGSGTWSSVIAGIDWVGNSTRRPAVANLSIGGGVSAAMNTAVANAIAKGVTMVVAAGNDNRDACSYSPASAPGAITVGATSNADARASFSNWGRCVDIFAPGVGITSAWYTSATATNTISGTSMATPHTAGAAALVLQGNPGATPAAVASFLTSRASVNKITSAGTNSPNLLLYAMGSGTPTEPPKIKIAVKSMTSALSFSSTLWQARVSITVRDVASGADMANVTVRGSFAPGTAATCVTTSTGSCILTSSTYSRSTVAATVYTVSNLTGSNMVYDATQNSIVQLRVNKP